MINISEVISGMTSIGGNSVHRYEYSCRCGWIDWDHARADRPDALHIRSQFPHPPMAGGLTLGQIRWLPDQGMGRTFRVSLPRELLLESANRYVRDYARETHKYFEIALAIYLEVCRAQENLQALGDRAGAATHIPSGNSGYSFEDMTSNVLAFYQTMMGHSREQIRRLCQVVPQPEAVTLIRTMTDAERRSQNRHPYQPILWHTHTELANCCQSCRGVPAQMPPELTRVRIIPSSGYY